MKIQEKLLIAWKVFTLSLLFFIVLVTIYYPLKMIYSIIFSILSGIISVWIAKYKGVDVRWAGLYGFMYGIFSIFYYAVLPAVKDNKRL